MKKRIISFAIASLVMISPLASIVDATSASQGNGISKGYIKGYTETEFKPEFEVKRSEIATMIARKMELKDSAPSFTDVSSIDAHWAGGSIGALTAKKIINGYADGSFRPDISITRGELAKIMDNAYSQSSNADIKVEGSNLNDIANHWAESNIKRMESIGVLKGYNDGSFRPENFLTREEVVTALNRLSRVMDKRAQREVMFKFKVKNKFRDMEANRWSYAEVLDASTDYEYKKDGDVELLVKTQKPEEEYRYTFAGNEVLNREQTIEVLNIKRVSEGIPAVKEDSKLNELSKRIASADAKAIRKDSITGEELSSLMSAIGMNETTPPQRGSDLFKTSSKKSAFISDLLDDTLLAGQFSRSFDRVGIASSSATTGYTSFVAYLGFKSNVDALDLIFDNDEAKAIYQKVQAGK